MTGRFQRLLRASILLPLVVFLTIGAVDAAPFGIPRARTLKKSGLALFCSSARSMRGNAGSLQDWRHCVLAEVGIGGSPK